MLHACKLFVACLFIAILAMPVSAETVKIDCDAGGKIGEVLGRLNSGDTVSVSGTCRESVFIPRDASNITLDGQGKATIVGPAADVVPTKASDFSFFVLGKDIKIRGFKIIGGSHGIHLSGPASVVIDGNVIRESGGAIHLDKGSIGQIVNNTIEDNRGMGINLIENAYARIGFIVPTKQAPMPNIIRNNDGPGIIVARRSSAWIIGNTIEGNKGHGILVDRNSQVDVADNTINGNHGDGIHARYNSGVNLTSEGSERIDGPNQTDPNSLNEGVGIRCSVDGYVSGPQSTLTGRKGRKQIDGGCVDRIVLN